MYWLPKFHKRPYKARFIVNLSACTTTDFPNYQLLALPLSIFEVLKSRGFRTSSLSTYDFQHSVYLCPIIKIKKKLINLIESTIHREGILYLACDDEIDFFTSDDQKRFGLAKRFVTL